MNLKARNEEMRDFFNEKATGYDDVHMPMMNNKREISEHLPENTLNVLDLGAGTGLELIPLFEKFPNARVKCIDIAENQLKYLMERPFADRLEAVCGDFFSVDFGEDYDAVISSAALHHFDITEKEILYKKIFDCLKSGGVFVNSDRYMKTQADQDERFEKFYNNTHGMRHWDTPLTVENEKKTMEKAGFTGFYAVDLPDDKYKVMVGKKL